MIVGDGIILTGSSGGGASATSWEDVTVPATGWAQDTTNNCYKKTVTVTGMTAASRPTVVFCPPHDLSLLDSQEDAYNLVYAGESVSGGIQLYATDVPGASFKITISYT